MKFRQLINGLYNWINSSPNLMFMALKIDCDFKTFETGLGTERFFMQLKHRFKNIIVNCELIKRVTSNGSEDVVTILFYLPYYYGNNYTFSKPDTISSCELNYYEELPLIFYRRFYNSILDFVDPIVLCCGYEKEECKNMCKEEPKEEPKEELRELMNVVYEEFLDNLKENLKKANKILKANEKEEIRMQNNDEMIEEFKEIKDNEEKRMKEIETYYMANSASCSYGAYDSLEDAIEQAQRIDGNIKTITEVTEIRKIVWEKPNYAITKEEVLKQLECSFEYDEEAGYLSKDAIDWLIKKLKREEENGET